MNDFMIREKKAKCEIYNDSMQNWKKYPIQKAQLMIADVPYNVGTNFYGSSPSWYVGGDNKNGESDKAARAAFYSDFNFNLYEFFHFGAQLLKKEPKRGGRKREIIGRALHGGVLQFPTAADHDRRGGKAWIRKIYTACILQE